MSINTRNRGFTLIELMVALVLGLVVIGGVMGVFISTYQANAQNIKSVRLNEEMRAVMSLMTRDIRRAGGRGRTLTWGPTAPNPFANDSNWVVSANSSVSATNPNSCARFAYDTNWNGSVNSPSDLFGYRLRSIGNTRFIESRQTGTSCNGTGWEKITDENLMAVLGLNFTVTIEPGAPSVETRTVVVTLDAATHTRSGSPIGITAADCNNIDVACRRMVETVRIRNDALLP